MKTQKGFATIVGIIIGLLIIGGGAYLYTSSDGGDGKSEESSSRWEIDDTDTGDGTEYVRRDSEDSDITSQDSAHIGEDDSDEYPEGKPIISNIFPNSGPIGTNVELKGYNLLDNRGNQNLIIENSKGEFASFGFGDPEHLNLSEKYISMSFTVEEKVCKQWETDKGSPCSEGWMNIVPGEYKIYVTQGGFTGTISDKVSFTVVDDEIATGIIKSVYTEGNDLFLDIDYVIKNPSWKPGGNSGPAYTNDNPKIRTFKVKSDADILIQERLDKDSGELYQKTDFETFRTEYFTGYRKSNPWDIEVVDGVIVKITEYFLP